MTFKNIDCKEIFDCCKTWQKGSLCNSSQCPINLTHTPIITLVYISCKYTSKGKHVLWTISVLRLLILMMMTIEAAFSKYILLNIFISNVRFHENTHFPTNKNIFRWRGHDKPSHSYLVCSVFINRTDTEKRQLLRVRFFCGFFNFFCFTKVTHITWYRLVFIAQKNIIVVKSIEGWTKNPFIPTRQIWGTQKRLHHPDRISLNVVDSLFGFL